MATLLNWIMSEPGAVSLVGITSTISTHKSCLKGGEGRRRRKKKKEIDFFFSVSTKATNSAPFWEIEFSSTIMRKTTFQWSSFSLFFCLFYKLRKREKKTKWSGRIFFLLLIFRLNFDHNSCDGDDGGDTVPFFAKCKIWIELKWKKNVYDISTLCYYFRFTTFL